MNSKQFVKLLIAVVVLGGIGLAFKYSREKDWKDVAAGGGSKLLGDLDINQVAAVTIQSPDETLDLVRRDGNWVIKQRGDYPAKNSTVVEFVWKLADTKVVQKQPIGPSAYARMEVNQPDAEKGAGTKLELKDKDGKALKTFILGKEVMKKPEPNSPFGGSGYAIGRWLLDTADKENIISISETLSEADTDPKDWMDTSNFIKVAKLKSIEVQHPTNSFSWKVFREKEGGDWKLAGLKEGEEGDSSKLSAIGNPLSSPSFQDILVGKKDEELGFDKPIVIKLSTFEGFNYELTVGKPTKDDDYPVRVKVSATIKEKREAPKDEKPEDKEKADKEFAENVKKLKEKLEREKAMEKWTYLVTKWTLDSFFKERKEFIAEKKEEEKKEETKLPDTPTPLLKPAPTAPKAGSGSESKTEAAPAKKPEAKTEKPKAAPAKPAGEKTSAKPATDSGKKETAKPAPAKKPAEKPAPKPATAGKPAASKAPAKSQPASQQSAEKEAAKSDSPPAKK